MVVKFLLILYLTSALKFDTTKFDNNKHEYFWRRIESLSNYHTGELLIIYILMKRYVRLKIAQKYD